MEKYAGESERMEIQNNNRAVERKLSDAYYNENKARNIALIIAIAMAVFLLYASFSIADGKIRSNYLIDIRGMGTLATISLENGSETQYEQMKETSYLKDVGVKKNAAEGTVNGTWKGNLAYLDETAYEKLFAPAFTDIQGSYPVRENEIMMPVRCFEEMGIKKPKLGATVLIELQLENGNKKEGIFFVSGYYTDYIDAAVSVPEIFVSEAFLKQNQIALFPTDKIMAIQNSLDENIESRLYSDITMEYDSQQFYTENPMVMKSIEGMFGSLSIAVGCGILVILCAFLLIYNVVSISIGRDIRQYGLLKVLGTTNIQLKRIAYRQNIRNIIRGEFAGSIVGIVIVKLFLAKVLQKLFMQGLGKSDVSGFYIQYLFISILLVMVTAFLATSMAVRQVIKWNALYSIKYVGTDVSSNKKQIRSTNKMGILKLAWRNVTRSRKKLIVSIFSLVLAAITALCAVVIMTGTDITNKIEQNPDFQIGILAGIFRYPEKVPQEINDDTPVISEETLQTINNMDEIEKKTIVLTSGCYAVIDFSKDVALKPKQESMEGMESEQAFATIQIIDNNYISKLDKYVAEYNLDVDIEDLKNGTGCVLLHHNEMSQILNNKAKDSLGLPIHFYSLNAYGRQKDEDAYAKGTLSCAGYMDMTDTFFPKLQMTSIGNNINYFIMTREAFENLGLKEKYFDISFDVKDQDKATIHQKLSQIVQKENIKSGDMDTFYLGANYLLLQTEQTKITTANIILGGLVLSIFLIGILNFVNTLATNFTIRKRELAIMESIGLSRSQKRKMLFMEGLLYWLITMGGIITLGSIVIWGLGIGIGHRLLYFKFLYPWETILILGVTLFVINMVMAQLAYCYDRKQSLTIRIQEC